MSNTDDATAAVIDSFITPSTPVTQPGSFGAIEPAISAVASDFTIPLSEYKWNQVVEIQLSDGKKVRSTKETKNLCGLKIFFSLDGGGSYHLGNYVRR